MSANHSSSQIGSERAYQRAGGIGLGAYGVKRHQKQLRDNVLCISKGSIRRLARRGGVKRIKIDIYDTIRTELKAWLEKILKNSILYMENRRSKTLTSLDIIHALNLQGRPLYGFDPQKQQHRSGRH